MSIFELTREQKDALKQAVYTDWSINTWDESPSYGELVACLDIITDSDLETQFAGTIFSDNDFWCTCAC